MNDDPHPTFPVFVSSVCGELWDLRAKIYHDIGRENHIFVDEQFNKHRDVTKQDDLEVADELISRVREAKAFVCILGGSGHGSPIKVHDNPTTVSFFEIELFQAALLKKEIHVFVRGDFIPGPRLEVLLDVLKFAFPEWRGLKTHSESEILSGVQRVLDRILDQRTINPWLTVRAPIRRLVQALYAARAKNHSSPSIFFLDGATEPRGVTPRLDVLQALADELQQQSNEEKRLSRLWIGLRELMPLPYEELRDQELLGHWNRLLGQWVRAAAWYGLHGDTPLGCLAALNTQTKVRERAAELFPRQSGAADVAYPAGALASAKYSIGKRLYIREDREARFNEALSDIKWALDIDSGDKSGLLAIRGSVFRQLGRIADCINDYEEVLRIRQRSSYPDSAIGEALCELGYGYLRQFSPRKGLRFCEEGLEKLRQGGRAGFLARGLRKLAVAYLVNGRLGKAYEAREEAKAVAIKHGALDQL